MCLRQYKNTNENLHKQAPLTFCHTFLLSIPHNHSLLRTYHFLATLAPNHPSTYTHVGTCSRGAISKVPELIAYAHRSPVQLRHTATARPPQFRCCRDSLQTVYLCMCAMYMFIHHPNIVFLHRLLIADFFAIYRLFIYTNGSSFIYIVYLSTISLLCIVSLFIPTISRLFM